MINNTQDKNINYSTKKKLITQDKVHIQWYLFNFQKSVPILMQYIHKVSILYYQCPSVILYINSKLNEGIFIKVNNI